MALYFLLSVCEFLSYLMNQVPLFHPLYSDQLHMLVIVAFLLNSFNDCCVHSVFPSYKGMVCHIQYMRRMIILFKEFRNLFKLIYLYYSKWESYALISISNHIMVLTTIIQLIIFPPTDLLITLFHPLILIVYHLIIWVLVELLRHFNHC